MQTRQIAGALVAAATSLRNANLGQAQTFIEEITDEWDCADALMFHQTRRVFPTGV
jgi:hypothetical protein